MELFSTKVGSTGVTTNGEEEALCVGCVEGEDCGIILR